MSDRDQLNTMSDRELAAYWNIMQFPGLEIGGTYAAHRPIVSALLTERGIPHQAGSRTVLAA